MTIPIRNVYYLLAYAFDNWSEGDMAALETEDIEQLHDLLGHLLASGVADLIRRGLDREYIEVSRDVAGVRGKLDFGTTLKRQLLTRASTHCVVDELRHDVLQNRILKATLRELLRVPLLDRRIRNEVRQAHEKLEGVSSIAMRRQHFRSVRIHRNNRRYRFLLSICLLLHDHLLVNETTGDTELRDFRRDDARMWSLFERFVTNFFRREQAQFQVQAQKRIDWHEAKASEEAMARLPVMKPDILLEGTGRRILADTKFYQQTFGGQFSEKLHSSNLYQLFAYLENDRAARLPEAPFPEGLLIYPAVGQRVRLEYTLKQHRVRAATVDLSGHWTAIRGELLGLLN